MIKLFKMISRLILCIVVLSLILLGVYAYCFSPKDYTFTKQEYISTKVTDNLNGMTIAYLSDIHLSDDTSLDRFTKIVQKLNEHPFDMVVFGGDLFDGEVFKNTEISVLLKSIQCKYGKFALLGEKDVSTKQITQIFNDGGFEVLNNEMRTIYYNDATFQLIASDGNYEINKDKMSNINLYICFSHKPDTFSYYKDYVDLQISGHSYGGQIYIPYVGPMFKTEGAMTYNHGTYVENNSTLIVSNGVSGPVSFPYKLFARNQVNFITLKNK